MAANRESTLYINDAFLPFINDTHRFAVLYGGAGCFDGDTLICTDKGHKKISNVSIGDYVLSYDTQTNTPEFKRVVDKFCYKVGDIRQKIITFVYNNQLIIATHEHRFYLQGTWVKADELARRAMEASNDGEWMVLYQQFRAAIYNKPLRVKENSNNEAIFRWRRVLSDCDCKKGLSRKIKYHKDSQACCTGICTKPEEPTRSKSQERNKNRQQGRKSGMGNTSTEYETFISDGASIYKGGKTPAKKITGFRFNKTSEFEKTCPTDFDTATCRRNGCEILNSKRLCLQKEAWMATSELQPAGISEINVYEHINPVYDLEVEDNHNYTITTDNIIVHNSGKSVSASQKIVMRCLSEIGTKDNPFHHKIAAIRKFRTSIKHSVFKQIKDVCISMNLEQLGLVRFNESYLEIKFSNGAEIFCSGLDDPEKIKSLVTTSIWIEEATELEQADFEQLDLRLRGITPYYQQIIITFNPVDENHWIKAKFFDKKSDMVYIMHSTYKDNKFLKDEYKQTLEERQKYDENQYRIYVKGEWGRIKTGSEYYFNFRYEKHVVPTVKYISGLPLHISFDFNVNPYISATISQIYGRPVDGGKRTHYFVNVIDEFALTNPYNTTERLCEHIITKYKEELKYGCFIYGDATGKHKTTRGNISDYDVIEYAFARYMTNSSMRVPKANPMIKKRRNFINKLLYGGFPNIQLQISPQCVKLINDFQVAIEEQDGSKKKQMGKDPLSHVVYEKNGHHADCNDYFLCAVFENYFESI